MFGWFWMILLEYVGWCLPAPSINVFAAFLMTCHTCRCRAWCWEKYGADRFAGLRCEWLWVVGNGLGRSRRYLDTREILKLFVKGLCGLLWVHMDSLMYQRGAPPMYPLCFILFCEQFVRWFSLIFKFLYWSWLGSQMYQRGLPPCTPWASCISGSHSARTYHTIPF